MGSSAHHFVTRITFRALLLAASTADVDLACRRVRGFVRFVTRITGERPLSWAFVKLSALPAALPDRSSTTPSEKRVHVSLSR
jgi:hypothetical protein